MSVAETDDTREKSNGRTANEKTTSVDTSVNSGFRARLEGLTLFDLVQMECIARTRRVMRVTSGGRVGYLFFREGEIVHATTRNVVGERAALEMLGWTDGVFEPCNIVWPERDTIQSSWQNLLIASATAKDEDAAGKLVRLPSRRPAALEAASRRPVPSEPPPSKAPDTVRPPPPSGSAAPNETAMKSAQGLTTNGVQRAVRIDPNGKVLSTAGDTTELVGFAAYAARVGDLIGQALGLEKFQAFELSYETTRCLLYIEDGGNIVVVESKNGAELGSMARKAGL